MERVLLVGAGGALGSMLRCLLGGWIGRLKSGWTFPIETMIVNVTGCLVIGYLAGLSETRGVFTGNTRAFLLIGVLGGYTTFSTFGYETFQLIGDAQWLAAAASVALQVGLGLTGVWAGSMLARLTTGGK